MTSVEYLSEYLSDKLSKEEKEWAIKSATQIHESEIVKAFEDGRTTGFTGFQWADGKFYYNEIFNTEFE